MSATEALERAQAARRSGDLSACLLLASACAGEAESEHDPETAYLALSQAGAMHLSRCEPLEALGHLRWALDCAMRGNLIQRVAEAHHWIYLALRDTFSPEAPRHWATAFTLYVDADPRARNVEVLHADRAEGEFSAAPSPESAAFALQSWRACSVRSPSARSVLIASCNILNAASVLGIVSRYESAAEQLNESRAQLEEEEGLAWSLVTAAQAAARMQHFEQAASWAADARAVAASRGEAVLVGRADEAVYAALAEQRVRV